MALDLPVLFGTVRWERRSLWVARYVTARLQQRAGVTTRLWDPVDLPFGNLVRREWEMTDRPAAVDEFVRAMDRADGFVLVTPEYNFGIPGTLKNLLDHLHDEWERKPFGFVTAGSVFGGVRAQDHLRQVVTGIHGITVPMALAVPRVGETWEPTGPKQGREEWDARCQTFFSELEWYAAALQVARQSH